MISDDDLGLITVRDDPAGAVEILSAAAASQGTPA